MSLTSKIQETDKRFKCLYKFLKEEYGPQAINNLVKNRMEVHLMQKVAEQLKKDTLQYSDDNIMRMLSQQNSKEGPSKYDDAFLIKFHKYLNGKNTELTQKNKLLESIQGNLKTSVNNMNTKEIASLKIEEKPYLDNIFRSLFVILYGLPENSYSWKEFKEKSLLLYKGEDFQSRMASIKFETLNEDQVNMIRKCKDDPQFLNLIVQDKNSFEKLINLSEWMEYFVNGYTFQQEKLGLEKEVQRIKGELRSRGVLNLDTKDQEQWTEVCQENQEMIDLVDNMTNYLADFSQNLKNLEEIYENKDKQYQSYYRQITSSMKLSLSKDKLEKIDQFEQ